MPLLVRRVFRPHPELPDIWSGRQTRLRAIDPDLQLTLTAEGANFRADERWSRVHINEYPLEPKLAASLVSGPDHFDVVVRASKPLGQRDKLVPIIDTKRLRLRALRHADAERLHRAVSDPETMKYWSRGPFGSLEETRGYLTWNVEADEATCWSISTRTAPDICHGWVILRGDRPKVQEVGYILAPDARRQGLAREAVEAVVEYAFETLGVRRVFADIDPDNQPSLSLLDNLGFEREGYLRAEWETHIGIRDSVIMARIRTPRVPR